MASLNLQLYLEHAISKCFVKNTKGGPIHSAHFEAENSDWKDGFNSNAVFGRIIYEDKQGKKRCSDSIMMKLMGSLDTRGKFLDLTFANEIYVYSQIIPFFATGNSEIWSLFPKFYYGNTTVVVGGDTDKENDAALIMLENLSSSGYRMTGKRSFLSIEELRLIMKKLAHFHAYSYYFKSKSPKEFFSLVGNLVETHYVGTREKIGYLNISSDHHIDVLSKEERYREKAELLRRILEDADGFLLRMYQTAKEPMAVVCHGDFLRNNLMFQYDSLGRPENVKFFDLACCRYCSPMIDLALILYMNTDQNTRTLYWEELIDIYCMSLREPFPDNNVPSRKQVVEEFRINSLNAFLIVAFFLPQMIRSDEMPNYDPIERRNFPSDYDLNASWFDMPASIDREIFYRLHRPRDEQVVLEVLKDIIDRGFV